jgi:hypothetical protein
VAPEADAGLGGSSPSPAGVGGLEGQDCGLGPQEEKEGQSKHARGEGQAGGNVDPGQAGLSSPVLTHLSSAGGGALMNAMNMLRSAVGYGGAHLPLALLGAPVDIGALVKTWVTVSGSEHTNAKSVTCL